jgi:hypothetical protein
MSLTWEDDSIEVYTTATANLTFADDDVNKVFIDWGDGTSQTLKEGINQWSDLSKSSANASFTHTYTKTGSFAPVIRTVNKRGYVSKYYGSASTNSDLKPYESRGSAISPITITDGAPTSLLKIENKQVLSGIDNNIFNEGPKDVYIQLAPTLASGLSGDNILTMGNWTDPALQGGYKMTVEAILATPTISGSMEYGYNTAVVPITKHFQLDDPPYQMNLTSGSSLSISGASKIVGINKVTLNTLRFPEASGATDATVNNLNKVKFFLIAQGDSGFYYPITYVSNGDPIKSLNDERRLVRLDSSESRTKASNASCSSFNYDNGKFSWAPFSQWQASGATALSGNTQTVKKNITEGYTYYTRPDGLQGLGYPGSMMGFLPPPFTNTHTVVGHDAKGAGITAGFVGSTSLHVQDQFTLNPFNQFYDYHHLARMTTKTDTDKVSSLDTFDIVARVDPPRDAGDASTQNYRPSYFMNSTGLVGSVSGTLSYMYTTGSYMNALASNGQTGTSWSGTRLAPQVPTDQYPIMENWGLYENTKSGTDGGVAGNFDNDYKREAPEYFILGNDVPYSKLFCEVTPYASGMTARTNLGDEIGLGTQSGNRIAGVYYLRVTNEEYNDKFTQKCEWVPLEFEDTTKISKEYRNSSSATYEEKSTSLARPGYIQYNEPSDWGKISLSGMGGGLWGCSGTGVEQPAPNVYNSSNDYSINLGTLTFEEVVPNTGKWPSFNQIVLSGANIGTLLSKYTDAQLSDYKYLMHVSGNGPISTASDHGRVAWLASSSIADNKLYIISGTQQAVPIDWVSGSNDWFIRRINHYEVFEGSSKVDNGGLPPNLDISATGAGFGPGNVFQYPYVFSWGGNNIEVKNDISSQWGGTELYPLKIIVSGAGFSLTSGANGGVGMNQMGPELWNILPFDNTNSQLIIQKDNTAFDLSYMPINSDVSMNYAGTFYQAITKGGRVFIVRTGTPIQTITLASKAMGTEQSFSYSDEYTSFGILEKIRNAQASATRVMWDEKQKDGTWVRFFGVITSVSETHSVNGPRAPRDFNAELVVEEICLIDSAGELISGIVPLGGIADARTFF